LNGKTVQILLAMASAVSLIAVGAWYHAGTALHDSRAQFVTDTLEPIAVLLKENQALIKELESDRFAENGAGILASYLAKIRRDGVAKHADMKQRLDQIAESNSAIVTLIKAYAPQAKTPAFSREADKFRTYAIAWRDRWNSVMELFMAGGNYPAAGVPFPNGFPGAVQAEILAAR
jgi:hypothetical protein